MTNYLFKITHNEIVCAVKLADRIHNLSEALLAPIEFRKKYIKESEEWYSPIVVGTVFEIDYNNLLQAVKDSLQ